MGSSGCFSRPSYQKVFQKDKTTVRLRHYTKGFSTVEKGFEHPFNISSVRAAHILSRIDIRRKSGDGAKRVPAIPTELVYTLGDGLSKAFKEAGPNDEVVVQAIVRSRRF